MERVKRRLGSLGVLAAVALAAACGDDPVGTDNRPPVPPRPFDIFDIYLRPLAIQRPSPGAATPNPMLAVHSLTAFYRGGSGNPRFDWAVPAALGTVEPKTPSLTANDATVHLRLSTSAPLPLGFHDFRVLGTSGTERDSVRLRFAVMQNTWMKHRRTGPDRVPPDLVQSPMFLTAPGRTLEADSVLYVEAPGPTTTRLRRIPAYRPLNGPEVPPGDVVLRPTGSGTNNFDTAPSLSPDLSPPQLGRHEILFTSQMDIRLAERCPQAGCTAPIPFNLWVVRRPGVLGALRPRAVTHDTIVGQSHSGPVFRTSNFREPRWDPSGTNPNARISFVTDLGGDGRRDIWLGEMVDLNGDARSDTLINMRRLTRVGVHSHAWHPDGSRILFSVLRGLNWVDPNTGNVTPIAIADTLLTRFGGVSVFWRPGEHTLIAFQAVSENQSNLYVFDEDDRTLTRVLPFPFLITHNLFPRWHPYRKELLYVSDYTVAAWANSAGADAGSPDRLHPNTPVYEGQSRTSFPSMWALRFEEPAALR